jgi:hypothetical protein
LVLHKRGYSRSGLESCMNGSARRGLDIDGNTWFTVFDNYPS